MSHRNKQFLLWLTPLLAFLILLIGNYWIYRSTEKIIYSLLRSESRNSAEQVSMRLDLLLYERGKDITHLSSLWLNYSKDTQVQRFANDAKGMVNREQTYNSISFIDTNGNILLSVPANGNNVFDSLNLMRYYREIPNMKNHVTSAIVISLPFCTPDGIEAIALFSPVYGTINGSLKLIGMIGAALKKDHLIRSIVKGALHDDLQMKIKIDPSELYNTDSAHTKTTERRACSETVIRLGNRFWTITVCPPETNTFLQGLLNGNTLRFFINIFATFIAFALLVLLLMSNNRLSKSRNNVAESEAAYKRLAEDREKLIIELESRNADLERFTYTISHELKTPLITIRGFLGYLEKEASDGDLDRLHKDIVHIVGATETMRRLLNGLIELIKISRGRKEPEEVSFGKLVEEAIDFFGLTIDQKKISVIVQKNLPSVYGDRSSLFEIVQILLENAIKFTGDQKNPTVEIGLTEYNNEKVFFIKDNGLGFNPKYKEQIFGLFNKLDPMSEGTGVGLALARRIANTHGGWIIAESQGIEKGTTMYFKLEMVNS